MKFKINKKLIFYILTPLIIGFIGNLLGGNTDIYQKINTPVFAPPKILFPIVRSILYVLMGISAYLVSGEKDSSYVLKVYYIQLGINALWSLLFFRFNLFLVSSIWLFILLTTVIYMCILFYNKNKTAFYLQIPYIIWLSFALLLNISIYILNV